MLTDVVVVTYDSAATVRQSLEPLVDCDSARIIVVDNASRDSTLNVIEGLPVDVIALDGNRGFAHGCNVGIAAGTAPFVLLLNPDARLDRESLERLVRDLQEHEQAGATAPRILEPDGSLDHSLRRFPRLRSTFAQALFLHRVAPKAGWVDEVIRDPASYEYAHAVEWVSGACVLLRRALLDQLGGLDEDFFHYGEDMDLCMRIRKAGFEVRFVPTAVAVHEGGASAPRSRLLPILAASRIRYARKHNPPLTALLERLGVMLGSATHSIVSRGGWEARRSHLRALRVALGPLPTDPSRLVRGR